MVLGSAITFRAFKYAMTETRKKYFLLFGFLIITLGILCFLLEKNWFIGLKPSIKVPFYGLLGISVSYALTFAIVDIVNYTFSHIFRGKTVIENIQQTTAAVIGSIVMGGVFGLIFGVMDIEDAGNYHFKLSLMKEELYCFPIGWGIGFINGCMNEYLRKDLIKHIDSFEDEI